MKTYEIKEEHIKIAKKLTITWLKKTVYATYSELKQFSDKIENEDRKNWTCGNDEIEDTFLEMRRNNLEKKVGKMSKKKIREEINRLTTKIGTMENEDIHYLILLRNESVYRMNFITHTSKYKLSV